MLRRLKFYFIGFGIGLLMVYFMFFRESERDLDKWMPEQRILEEIREDSLLIHSASFGCAVNCYQLNDLDLAELLHEGQVKSLSPGGNPYVYQISYSDGEKALEMKVEKQNDVLNFVYLKDLKNTATNCNCP